MESTKSGFLRLMCLTSGDFWRRIGHDANSVREQCTVSYMRGRVAYGDRPSITVDPFLPQLPRSAGNGFLLPT